MWDEVKIGIVVSQRSYGLGFNRRVHDTDYYCYFTNETIDELKRRGYAGLYKLSDSDFNDASVLGDYDIVWVSSMTVNVSQQLAVQDYVNAGGLAIIGGATYMGNWVGTLSTSNYKNKVFTNLNEYLSFATNYPFDIFGLKSVPTVKVIDNGTSGISGKGYIMDISRSDTNLGWQYGSNSQNGNPVLIVTPRGSGYVAQLTVDIVAMIGGMIAYPMGYTGVSYTGKGSNGAVADTYIYLFNRINAMLLQKKGYFGWAYGHLLKPLVGELPQIIWNGKHDIDSTIFWSYAFETGNGTINYKLLLDEFSLKSQWNIRLQNTSNPSGQPIYDISKNSTKLNFLKQLINEGHGVALHVEPWNNLTGSNALSYFQYDKAKWDSLFAGYTTPLTVWGHGAGYMDFYVDRTWKDLMDAGFIGQSGHRNYYLTCNSSGRIYDYGQKYTGYMSWFPFYAPPKYLDEQPIDFVVIPTAGRSEGDPQSVYNYEYALNNTAIVSGVYGVCLHPLEVLTTCTEYETILSFVKKLRNAGYIIEYVNPDIIVNWFKDFVNINVTKIEVDTASIRVSVQNIGNYTINDYTLRFDVAGTATTSDSHFYYQKGNEFYVVIPSLAPSETTVVTVYGGIPAEPYIQWSGDQKKMHLTNVTNIQYANDKFSFTISADSGVTSTSKVQVGDKGEPISVYGATWSYDDSTRTLTLTVHHEGSEEVVVRWSGAADSIDGQQYYLWGEEPLWPIHQNQNLTGTGSDVGSLRKARPSSWQRRNCSYGGFFFFDQEGTYDSEKHNFNKLYFRFYWSSFEFGSLFGYRRAGIYGGLPDGSKNVTDSVGLYYTNASADITIHSDFKLSVGLLDMDGSVVGNAIYNMSIYFLRMVEYSPPYPMVLSPPHDPSFIIINPPNNTTLQNMDTDGDGLSDYDEMFTYYTDPRHPDTYSLGWKDDGSPLSSYDYPWRRFQAFFNDSTRTKILNFDGTQSQFVYARLFKYNYIQNASLSIASFPKPLEAIRAPADAFGDGWRIFGVAIGDVNNDGKNELLTGDMVGNVRVWNTTSWTIIFGFDTGTQASGFAIGDLLNDAGNEFVVGSNEGNVYVFNSTFQQKWTADIGSNAFAFAIDDVDGDGANELVVGGRPFLLVYNSSFAVETNITTCQPYGWGLAVGDANNDGLPDIAVSSIYNYVNVYNSSGTYQLITRFQALENVFGWPRVHVSDIDNDGKNEIVVAGANGVSVWRLEGTSLASVWNSSYIGARPETIYPKMGSAVADLNGDGKKEIVVSGHNPRYNGTVYIINSLGKVVYRFNSPRQVCGIAVDDVDNDGDDDIVFGRESTNIITIYDGLPKNIAVDVGDDGTNEFSFAGLYTYNMTVDIKSAVNSYLTSSSDYWVDVPIRITCTRGTLGLTANVQYTAFSSQDLDDLNNNYKNSNFPYVLNITNGGITALSYSSERTGLTIESSYGTTSITKMNSSCKREPLGVEGTTSWSYDNATKILTLIITHSSAQNVEVYWPISGDLNRDGIVDVVDFHILSKAYDATPSSPNWNPDCDLNCDNIITTIDLSILSENYGKTSN